jgi:hypothetical protein
MTDASKTLALVAAAGLAVAATVFTRPATREIALVSDLGKPLAPALTDALAVRALEVVSYDDTQAKTLAFKVQSDGQRWTIPSHSGYPADAADKVAAAASAFIGLVREQVASENPADHAAYGVLDPAGESAGLTPGTTGTRVTMRDAAGNALADLIIGKAVGAAATPTPFEQPSARRYVREAGRNRVFVTSINTGFSTRFADWVQTDLLQTYPEQIVGLVFDRYRIDKDQSVVVDRQTIKVDRVNRDDQPTPTPQGDKPWSLVSEPGGAPGAGETVNVQRINEAVTTLTGLKIIGVRPKPANLVKAMGGSEDAVQLTQFDQLNLQTRGFYLSRQGRLLADNGQVQVQSDDGVLYSLWLGEVVPEGEDAASGGQVGGTAAKDTPADAKKPDARYLMITVSFDETALPEPVKPAILDRPPAPSPAATEVAPLPVPAPAAEPPATPDPAAPPSPPEQPGGGDHAGISVDSLDDPPGQGGAPAPAAEPPPAPPASPATGSAPAEPPAEPPEVASARMAYESAVEQRKAKLEAGKKRAETLARRFADWYYVIDGTSVASLRPQRADLVTPAPPAPAAPALTPGEPATPAAPAPSPAPSSTPPAVPPVPPPGG